MINYIIMIAAVVGLAIAAAIAGRRIGRAPNSLGWWAGLLIPLSLILATGATRRFPLLTSPEPIRWILRHRLEYIVLAGAVSMMLVVINARMKRTAVRRLIGAIGIVFVGWGCVGPLLMPKLMRSTFANMPAMIDRNGICRQQTAYTCGPASAVTALRYFGISASEGELADLFQTSPAGGTEPYLAADALQERYTDQGLRVECRLFNNSSELPARTPMLAVVHFSWLVDHIVAIVRRPSGFIEIGDPASGWRVESAAKFESHWRGEAVVLERV